MRRFRLLLLSILLFFQVTFVFAGLRPIVPAEGYVHDRFVTEPKDQIREFRAFITSFDGDDDGLALCVPEWVAYEIKKAPSDLGKAPKRPSTWFTDEELFSQGIAPNDATYKGSGYSRGHMCMKSLAWRLGADADYNTHTVLNACPQLQSLNAGAWLHLEELTGDWADEYDQIWVVCGPVFLKKQIHWIGDEGEVKAAVPDAFYKIVVKQAPSKTLPDILAFIFPHAGGPSLSSKTSDLTPYLTSVDIIEALTGLDFLTSLEDQVEDRLEQEVSTELWPTKETIAVKPIIEAISPESPPAISRKSGTQQKTTTVQLREGVEPTDEEIQIATKLVSLGWTYYMPSPKSPQARWGNSDGRTTWWNGYWMNSNTNKVSASQPKEENNYQGDGTDPRGWRRGGSPRWPTVVEWLCSKSGGVKPL